MSLKARIVAGDVARGAAVYVRTAELSYDDLFDPRGTFVERMPLSEVQQRMCALVETGPTAMVTVDCSRQYRNG